MLNMNLVPASSKLPDNAAYTNRFKIHSQSSANVYTVAQSKSGRWWSCSCKGWIFHKHCKHLKSLGLPGNYVPMEVEGASTQRVQFAHA